MKWRNHTELPAGKDLALIAVQREGAAPFFLPELYYYDAADGHWYGCANRLQIKHPAFRWLSVHDLLQTLP